MAFQLKKYQIYDLDGIFFVSKTLLYPNTLSYDTCQYFDTSAKKLELFERQKKI